MASQTWEAEIERRALTVSMRTARRYHRDNAVLSSSSSVDEVCTIAVQQVYLDKTSEDFYRARCQRLLYFSSFLKTRIRMVTGTALPRSRGGAVGFPHASISLDCKMVKCGVSERGSVEGREESED